MNPESGIRVCLRKTKAVFEGNGDVGWGVEIRTLGSPREHARNKCSGSSIYLERTWPRGKQEKLLKVSDYTPSKIKKPRWYATCARRQVKYREEDLLAFTDQCKCAGKHSRKIWTSNRRISHSGAYQWTIYRFNNSKSYLTLKLFLNQVLIILQVSGSDEHLCMDGRRKAKRQLLRRTQSASKLTWEEDAMGNPFDITLSSKQSARKEQRFSFLQITN